MKTTFATTFSIVGVLAAGGIAFAVNTSVLDTATNQISASQAIVAETVGIVPTENAPVVEPTATTVAPPAIVETAYNIAGVGVVTLSQNSNALSVSKVVPASGYTFTSVNESVSRIEVTFKSGSKTLKFHAEIIGGRIITSVLNEPTPLDGAPHPKTHDEDHDEDHHEEGEGEDDDD
jgi:hypothetical protein